MPSFLRLAETQRQLIARVIVILPSSVSRAAWSSDIAAIVSPSSCSRWLRAARAPLTVRTRGLMIGKRIPGTLTSAGVCRAWASRWGLSTMSENVDSLTVYCRDDKRVCPLPKAWQQLWEMLPEKRRTVDAWEPAMPLIGPAWHETPAMLKMVRLAEHIQWAAKHNALPEVAAFLRGLREDEWHHLGE